MDSQETQKKESSSGCLTFISLYFAIMVGPALMLLSTVASDNPDSKNTAIIGFLIGLAITILGIYIVVRTTSKNYAANKLKQINKIK